MEGRLSDERETARLCLDALSPMRAASYESWVAVGMALHSAGASVEDWIRWQPDGARDHDATCRQKWAGFGTYTGAKTTIATLVKWAKEDDPTFRPPAREHTDGHALTWESPIGPRSPAPDISLDQLAPAEIPDPGPDWPAGDLINYLRALYQPGEVVSYVLDSFQDADGNWKPGARGVYTRTAGEIIAATEKHAADLSFALGDWTPEAGAWCRLNPMDGSGVRNDNVKEYRHVLVESDSMPLDRQLAVIREMNLPAAALVHSGGKSIHAIVKIDAGTDPKLYRERVDFLFDTLARNGFAVDRQCRNPSRLSRMPGITRGDRKQYLIATHTGAPSWAAWETAQRAPEYTVDAITPERLATIDVVKEDDSLLGNRFLCRDGSWLIVAQSGIGKSVFAIQAAICFAIGRDLFGLAPRRPLRQVLIQAENNLLDLVEPFQSIVQMMDLSTDETARLRQNLQIVSEDTQAGDRFAPFLDHLVKRFGVDLAWIDPLMAYIGDEIGKQSVCSRFLRNQINPVVHAHHLGLAILHHAGKPPKDTTKQAHGADLAYLGIGSSELTNWARAVSTILQSTENEAVYVLEHSKRGKRLGNARTVFLQHSAEGICWMPAGSPSHVAAADKAKTYGGKYAGMGFEHIGPCQHDPDHAKSGLLATIQRIMMEHGEPVDVKQADNIRTVIKKAGLICFHNHSWRGTLYADF